jgi:DNA invertase Pin-like site-specific DNA recombinase
MVMTIFAGIAEFERTLIISRTNDGRVTAKARGVVFGRPKKMRPDQQQLARELVRDGKSISAVARTFDVHPATIYRVIEGKEALRRFSVPLSRTGRLSRRPRLTETRQDRQLRP